MMTEVVMISVYGVAHDVIWIHGVYTPKTLVQGAETLNIDM